MQETHRRHMNAMEGMFASDPFMTPSMFRPERALEGPSRGGRSRDLQPHRSNPRAHPMVRHSLIE